MNHPLFAELAAWARLEVVLRCHEAKSLYAELECLPRREVDHLAERQVRVEERRALDVRPDAVAILPSNHGHGDATGIEILTGHLVRQGTGELPAVPR